MDLVESLNIPQDCIVNKTVYKKNILTQLEKNTSKKKLVEKHLKKLTWLYSLKESNTNISKLVTEELYYEEVVILKLEPIKYNQEILEIIHNIIPYPTILIIECEKVSYLSTALKRRSKVDNNKVVITNLYVSKPQQVQNLNFEKAIHNNLYDYYNYINDQVIKYKLAEYGIKPGDDNEQKLAKYNKIEQQMAEFQAQQKQTNNFSTKMAIIDKITQLEKQKKEI